MPSVRITVKSHPVKGPKTTDPSPTPVTTVPSTDPVPPSTDTTTPATIVIDPSSFSMTAGASSQLTATVYNSLGAVLTGVQPDAWHSSNTGVVTVDATGRFTAVAEGTAQITATITTPALTSNACTVTAEAPGSIVLSPSTLTLTSGTSQLTATVKDQAGSTMAGTQPDAWASENTRVVTVSSTGLVTFVAAGGPVNITASLTTVNGTITSNACAVTAQIAASISITPSTLILASGTSQLTAVVKDQTGATMTGVQPTAWQSADTSIVTVSATGLVTVVGAGGPVNITATISSVNGTIASNACAVTTRVPASIVVSPSSLSIASGTHQLTAVVNDQAGTAISGTQPDAWHSANTSVVTVDASGLVTFVGAGTTTVTATLSGITSNACTVTAQAALTPTTIVVTPNSLTIASGTSQLTAVVKDQNGATMAGVQPDAWHSSNSGVVTVSATGLVTFVSGGGGPVNVSASLSTVNGTITSNPCVVTAQAPTTIVVSPSSFTITSGTVQLTATVKDQNGTTMAGLQPDGWHSTNSSVVTVNSTGLVTFIGVGSSTVTATLSSPSLTSNGCAVTAASSSEPVYTAGVDTLIKQDSFDGYVSSTQMFLDRNNGLFQFSQYNGSGAFDDPGCQLLSPGRDGVSGKMLSCSFAGTNQESHEWWLQNSPTNDGPSRVKHVWSFWWRVRLSGWTLNQGDAGSEFPIKFFMAWHNNGNRIQPNTHNYLPGPLPPAGVPGCLFEIIDLMDTGCHQPVPPYATDLINDGQWHRFVMAVQPNTSPGVLDLDRSLVLSPSSRDGYARVWQDGTKILDVSAETVGVTPAGGWKPWCTFDDLDSLSERGFALLKFVANLTTTTAGPWAMDIDDFLWWTQP